MKPSLSRRLKRAVVSSSSALYIFSQAGVVATGTFIGAAAHAGEAQVEGCLPHQPCGGGGGAPPPHHEPPPPPHFNPPPQHNNPPPPHFNPPPPPPHFNPPPVQPPPHHQPPPVQPPHNNPPPVQPPHQPPPHNNPPPVQPPHQPPPHNNPPPVQPPHQPPPHNNPPPVQPPHQPPPHNNPPPVQPPHQPPPHNNPPPVQPPHHEPPPPPPSHGFPHPGHPPVQPPPHHMPPHPLPPVYHPPHHVPPRPPVYYPVPHCDPRWNYYCRHDGMPWYPYPYPQRPLPPLPPPVYYPAPAPSPSYESRQIVLNQTVVDQAQLDLRSLAGLYGGEYAGAVIESVDVYLAHQDYGVGLELITDGTTADAKNSVVDYAQLTPHFGAQIGNDLNSLMLQVDGSVVVTKIVVNIVHETEDYSSYHYDHDLILAQDVSVNVPDQGTLDLSDLIDLYNYEGYRVVSVAVSGASTNTNFSVLRFFANDLEQDRALIGTAADTRQFFIAGANQLGYDLSSLKIVADGALVITHVELRLEPMD